MRPAHRIRSIACRFLSDATMERLVDPILSDIEIERRESLQAGRVWRARWVVLNGYTALSRALALHGLYACARPGISIDGGGRTIAWSIAAFITLTLLFTLPPFLVTRSPLTADRGKLAITVVPQAIPLSLPLAVAFGVALAWPKRAISRIMLRRALILGIGGAALTLVTMEWLMPAGNQAFREIVFRRLTGDGVPAASIHLPRGPNERSISELVVLARRIPRKHLSGEYDRTESVIQELSAADPAFEPSQLSLQLHVRFALSFATGVICVLAAAIASATRGRNLGRIVFASASVFYVLTFMGYPPVARVVSPAIAAWLPTGVLALVAFVLLTTGRMERSSGR
jgi:lipopolysaccharide export LptBFGC system permease protein LptF